MKKFGTFAKVLCGVVIVLIICLATKKYWGIAAAGAIKWICDQLGVEEPEEITKLLRDDVTDIS